MWPHGAGIGCIVAPCGPQSSTLHTAQTACGSGRCAPSNRRAAPAPTARTAGGKAAPPASPGACARTPPPPGPACSASTPTCARPARPALLQAGERDAAYESAPPPWSPRPCGARRRAGLQPRRDAAVPQFLRLTRLIGDLLDVGRLETATLSVTKSPARPTAAKREVGTARFGGINWVGGLTLRSTSPSLGTIATEAVKLGSHRPGERSPSSYRCGRLKRLVGADMFVEGTVAAPTGTTVREETR